MALRAVCSLTACRRSPTPPSSTPSAAGATSKPSSIWFATRRIYLGSIGVEFMHIADPKVHLVEQRHEGGEPPPSTLLGSTWNRSAGIFSPARAMPIHSLSREGFKLGLSEAAEEDGGPVHTTRFGLVDCRGAIRGYYDAMAPDAVTKLLADTNHLLREQPR